MQTLQITSNKPGALGLVLAMRAAHQTPKESQPPEFPVHHNGDVITIDLFWDCECQERYIHYRGLKTLCLRCSTRAEDAPASRLEEVARYGLITNIPIGFRAGDGVRSAYIIDETMQDHHGNYIPLIVVEGMIGYFTTTWQFGKDKNTAEAICEELNASLGLTLSAVTNIRLSTMKF